MFQEITAAMPALQDAQIRRALGQRIKELRKQRKWTQKELAAQLDVRQPQLNRYESGAHVPPVDKLVLLAEIFHTTIDYLITGSETDAQPLHNLRLLERFRAIETFSAEDQEAIMRLIDGLIVKNRVEGALKVDRSRRTG